MAQVIMRCPSNPDEWTIVELQGSLAGRSKLDAEFAKTGFGGLELGVLSMRNGRPELVIGNHKLEGKKIELKKPFVVCRKIAATAGDSSNSTPASPARSGGKRKRSDAESSGSSSSSSSKAGAGAGSGSGTAAGAEEKYVQNAGSLVVQGVVRSKYVFVTRPEPIVSTAGAGSGSAAAAKKS